MDNRGLAESHFYPECLVNSQSVTRVFGLSRVSQSVPECPSDSLGALQSALDCPRLQSRHLVRSVSVILICFIY